MSGAEKSDDAADGEVPDADDDAVPQAGVLGNLPKSRPAVRSPRRKQRTAASEKPAAGAGERERPRPRADRPGSEPATESPPTSAGGDLDALARGGIAIAGEAASLGLRIAGRAAAALRDAVERR
jgi:hypothetical protein